MEKRDEVGSGAKEASIGRGEAQKGRKIANSQFQGLSWEKMGGKKRVQLGKKGGIRTTERPPLIKKEKKKINSPQQRSRKNERK